MFCEDNSETNLGKITQDGVELCLEFYQDSWIIQQNNQNLWCYCHSTTVYKMSLERHLIWFQKI